jgi:hypothetical protein
MREKEKDKKKKKLPIKTLRKIFALVILVLILLRWNPTLVFLIFFGIFGFLGKYIRGMFGLSMVVLDPNLFFFILIMKFLGVKWLIIFLFITLLSFDIITGIFSPGSLLNYVLYHICVIIPVVLFGNSSMMVYGNIASLFYSVMYIIFRTSFFFPSPLADDPVQVFSKSITSFLFTFLYITFFGPLFSILMA